MIKGLFVLAAVLATSPLSAAQAVDARLTRYAEHAFPRCPGQSIKVDPKAGGPSGFEVFHVDEKSTDKYCEDDRDLLVSPRTGQTLLGSITPLPDDARPLSDRLAEFGSKLLKVPATVRIAPLSLPDGLKAVSLLKETPFGHFGYDGFVDASEKYLIVGMRGTLNEAPETTLRNALGASAAAQRGKAAAKNEIIEISDFECPSCGLMHKLLEPAAARSLAKIHYIRLDLPLFMNHEWSFQAAMGARALQRVAPQKYWEYVNSVFANQEVLKKDTIDAFVKNFATDCDLDWAKLDAIYSSPAERQALLDQVSRTFALGINSTPTYLISGRMVGYADGDFTINTLRRAMGLPPVRLPRPAAQPK